MADNVTLNASSGTFSASSDDCAAAGQVQRIKLTVSADGDATHLPATAVDGLLVNLGANNDITNLMDSAGTATLTNVASSATSVQLLASTAGRKSMALYNDSTQILYIKFGTTASSSSYTVQVPPGGYYEMPYPVYTGRIDGIWASANGNARITELT